MTQLRTTVKSKDKVLVTAALPYANGMIHIGHLLEYIYTDIYVRFLRLMGKDALYICASDMHGTPIVLNAQKAGMKPIDFANKHAGEQLKDFETYHIKFDNYYSTDSNENKELAELFFKTFKEKGYIYVKEIEQLYDEEANQFLPDRFVKGTCPKCSAEDQYGDVCESCGATYDTSDLIKPYSTITKTTPILKKTKHYYFKLSQFSEQLREYVLSDEAALQKEVQNFALRWIDEGLNDWCISRDAPYFGFPIKESVEETGAQKYFYVWLDAPIGYISSTVNYCNKKGTDWKEYWNSENSHLVHIIGKDILYFHELFWPVMLKVMGFNLPTLTVHGFVTVDGKKMSKSRGTFFTAKQFFDLYGGESLRYYYAKHLDRTISDVNLSFEDFKAEVNNVFMGNLGNFCFRSLSFASRNYPAGLTSVANGADEKEIINEFNVLKQAIEDAYFDQDLKTVIKKVLQVGSLGNSYFQKAEPWRKREHEEEQAIVAEKVGFTVNLARNMAIILKPIVPEFSRKVEKSLGVESIVGDEGEGLHWKDINFDWTGTVSSPEKLVEKIDKLPETKDDEADSKKEKVKVSSKKEKVKSKSPDDVKEDEFPLDIRVGEIIEVNDHPNAEKLYVFKVNFGDFERQIIAGLKSYFSSSDLLNTKALFIVNLKPAKLRGEMSEGMTLAADDGGDKGDDKVSLLYVDSSVALGTQVSFEGFNTTNDIIGFDMFEKFQMSVKGSKVFWNNRCVSVDGKEVSVKNMPDGAKVR